jgi:hypothetical protein
MQGKPYFYRWDGPNFLGSFLEPVSQEIEQRLPKGATAAQLGAEESILLFLVDRTPTNNDWTGYYIWHEPVEDAVIFTDYGQGGANERRDELEKSGYRLAGQWPPDRKWVSLYLHRER